MASVSISHLIIFVASLIIAAGVVGVAFTGVDHFNEAMEDRSIAAAEELRTDITVISDSGSDGIYANGNITLHIKNTGQMTLPATKQRVDVFVNGQYVKADDLNLSVVGSDEAVWRRSDVVRADIHSGELESGDQRVTVVVNGDEEVLTFRVEDES